MKLGFYWLSSKILGAEATRFLWGQHRPLSDLDALRRNASMAPERGAFLEIGAWTGHSTRVLWQVAQSKGALLVCIEPFLFAESRLGRLLHRFFFRWRTRSCWPGFYHMEVDSRVVDPVPPLAFAFVDGCHIEPWVSSDLYLAVRHLVPGGILVVDDVKPAHPQILEAIERLDADPRVERLEETTGVQAVYRRLDVAAIEASGGGGLG